MSETIKGLIKLNVRARSKPQALQVFQGLLGAELISDRGSDTIGDFDGMMLRLGNLVIDVMVPNDPNGRLAQSIDKHGEGIDSIALEVTSMDEIEKSLTPSGVRLRNPTDFHGRRIAFISPRDACGVTIELIEPQQKPQ